MSFEALHTNDAMFNKAAMGWQEYETIGRDAIKVIRKGLRAHAKVGSVLDFGSGHGRVARWLAREFPDARRVYCDIDEEAWRFCAKNSGHSGFPRRKTSAN